MVIGVHRRQKTSLQVLVSRQPVWCPPWEQLHKIKGGKQTVSIIASSGLWRAGGRGHTYQIVIWQKTHWIPQITSNDSTSVYNRSTTICQQQKIIANRTKDSKIIWSLEHLVFRYFFLICASSLREHLYGWATPERPWSSPQLSSRKSQVSIQGEGERRQCPKETMDKWWVVITFLSSSNTSQHLLLC